MNIGFTTQTFAECMQSKQINEFEILDFAKASGFNWIEIRDKEFHTTDEVLQNLARQNDVRIHYAFDGYTLDEENYLEIFEKIAKRSAIFGKGTFSRVVMSSKLKGVNEEHIYSTDDFAILKERIENVIEIANRYKVIFAFENIFESAKGFSEIFDSIKNMNITLDTANFLVGTHQFAPIAVEEINDFCKKYDDRIKYIHLKSTLNNQLQNELLLNGDFCWDNIVKNDDKWYCIELPAINDLQNCKDRIIKARENVKRLFKI